MCLGKIPLCVTFIAFPFLCGRSGSWLQKQQQKLRARRESSWDDRHRKEAQLMAELRSTTAMRSPELQNGGGDSPLNGESPSFKVGHPTPITNAAIVCYCSRL